MSYLQSIIDVLLIASGRTIASIVLKLNRNLNQIKIYNSASGGNAKIITSKFSCTLDNDTPCRSAHSPEHSVAIYFHAKVFP